MVNSTTGYTNMLLPCKKNITLYEYQLFDSSNQQKPITLNKASILSIKPFKISGLHQKNNEIHFDIDREIEFEVIAKSFIAICSLGSITAKVEVIGNTHQYFCTYSDIKVFDRKVGLQIMIIVDNSKIEIASSLSQSLLSKSPTFISPNNIKIKLMKYHYY